MAILNKRDRTLLLGIVIGAGGLVLGRRLFGPITTLARPTAKVALKSGVSAMEWGRETTARLTEHLEDLAAEVAAEKLQGK